MITARSSDWGAHACSVPVSAFCRNNLSYRRESSGIVRIQEKFATAKCGRQHAPSVRSPEN
jgi:hypothetical protein